MRLADLPTPGVDPAADEALVERWDERATPWVVGAALLPIITAAAADDDVGVLLGAMEILCWAVFLVDLAVHVRWRRHFLRTRWGWFDLAIVVLTFPYYLFPAIPLTRGAGVLRLVRLVRVLYGRRNVGVVDRIVRRLNKPVLYTGMILVVCSLTVYVSDGAAAGFDDVWDAFWWGIVTLTTVGYGDLTPVSSTGRWAAVVLMIAALALVGTLAGTLADAFGLKENEEQDNEIAELKDEVAGLRRELRALGAALGAPVATDEPSGPTGDPSVAADEDVS